MYLNLKFFNETQTGLHVIVPFLVTIAYTAPSVALNGLVPVVCPAIISIALNTASMSTLRRSSRLTASPTMLPVGISMTELMF